MINMLIKTKWLEMNSREECGYLRRVETRFFSMIAAERERDKDNQAKVVTSLGTFYQVALGVNDMKEFVSFYLMEQEN